MEFMESEVQQCRESKIQLRRYFISPPFSFSCYHPPRFQLPLTFFACHPSQYLIYKGNDILTAIDGKIPGYRSEAGHPSNSKHCWHAFLPLPLLLPQAAPGCGICPLHLCHVLYSAEYEFSHYSEERETNCNVSKAPGFSNIT